MGAVAVNGTWLSREGAPPLLALTAMDGDRLLEATVVDPAQAENGELTFRVPHRVDTILSTFTVK